MQTIVRLNKPQTLARRHLKYGIEVATPWGRGVGKSRFQRETWYEQVARWDGKRRLDVLPQYVLEQWARTMTPRELEVARYAASTLQGIRIGHVMPTLKQAVAVHGKLLEAEIDGTWSFLGGKLNKTRWVVEFPGNSSIQFISAEVFDLSRGLRFDLITGDEIDDVEPSDFNAVATPWFSEPWSLKMALLGGTPLRGRNGLLYQRHRLGMDAKPGHASVFAEFRDAPENVDIADIERRFRDGLIPPEIFAREYECDFDSAQGLVYNIFVEATHVREPEEDPTWNEILVGVDHGYEDPGVFLLCGVDGTGREARIHAFHEVVAQHQTESWWLEKAAEIRGWYPTAKWYADPSRPDRIAALKKLGIRIEGAENDIKEGVDAVADRIVNRPNGGPRFFISKNCPFTISEFGKYKRKRDPRDRERVTDQIEDRDNHSMDALRYAIRTRFGIVPTGRNDANMEQRP